MVKRKRRKQILAGEAMDEWMEGGRDDRERDVLIVV